MLRLTATLNKVYFAFPWYLEPSVITQHKQMEPEN